MEIVKLGCICLHLAYWFEKDYSKEHSILCCPGPHVYEFYSPKKEGSYVKILEIPRDQLYMYLDLFDVPIKNVRK